MISNIGREVNILFEKSEKLGARTADRYRFLFKWNNAQQRFQLARDTGDKLLAGMLGLFFLLDVQLQRDDAGMEPLRKLLLANSSPIPPFPIIGMQ